MSPAWLLNACFSDVLSPEPGRGVGILGASFFSEMVGSGI